MKLVSIVDDPVPDGGVVGALKTRDGVSLRYARWTNEKTTKGTVCLLQGRAEFIEKYFEVVRELKARGFGVVTFDWRGQGLSDRALPDRNKGYVESFAQYDIDLEAIIEEVVLPNSSPPLIALAHSMGGAILLRLAAGNYRHFDRLVLTAPMVGLPHLGSSALVLAVLRGLRLCGLGNAYVPGGRDTIMELRPFVGNRRTSDLERYFRAAKIIAAKTDLGIGSPTIAWTGAAVEAMHQFADDAYPQRIRQRSLMVIPEGDQITSPAASKAFAVRSGVMSYVTVARAKHELLMEQAPYRAQFWSAFDSFTT
jgi:lysophospholipase